MDIIDLVAILSKKYKEKIGIAPAKTKLLKLAYLSEVYFKRLTGERLTDQEWIFWKYGPYLWNYDQIILNEGVFHKLEQADDFYPVEVKEDYRASEPNADIEGAILRALDHADEDLNQILDFIYFDTEPMMEAKSRGEKLDFTCILPEEFYKTRKYEIDRNAGIEIAKRIRYWEARKKNGV